MTMKPFQTIGIIGAGSWGTAIAQAIATAGRDVILWSFEEQVAADINVARENKSYLSSISLHESITCNGYKNGFGYGCGSSCDACSAYG